MSEDRLVVAGSLNMDLVATGIERLPGAGETVVGDGFFMAPGGKGSNQALAAGRIGEGVAMVGCVGDDVYGKQLLATLAESHVSSKFVRSVQRVPTGTALINVDRSGENQIVVIPGANHRVDAAFLDSVEAEGAFNNARLIVVQQEIPSAAVSYLLARAKARGIPVLLNAAPARAISPEDLAKVTTLVVNETEAGTMTGMEIKTPQDAAKALVTLRKMGVVQPVVTLGAEGAVAFVDGKPKHFRTYEVDTVVDTTGAGDTFVGALAMGMVEGMPFEKALQRALAASALSVRKPGASSSFPQRDEVEQFMTTQNPESTFIGV